MKITEIIDTEFTGVKRQEPYKYHDLRKQEVKHDNKHGVSGWYSRGYENPRDPHEFVKSTHLPSHLEMDAYYVYVKKIAELQKQNYHNPYFPVVYATRVTTDPRGMTRPRYRIEKLQPYTNFSAEAIYGMIERMFHDIEVVIRDIEVNEGTKGRIWDYLCGALENALLYQEWMDQIKDKKLVQALGIINQIINSADFGISLDIHEYNIMLRGTPYGPQLVLMDPISDDGASIVHADELM